MKKMEQTLVRTDERQVDCFWHDHSGSLKYLLVLHGVAQQSGVNDPVSYFSQNAGFVTKCSPAYRYLATKDPDVLPGASGPISIMLIL